MIRRFFLDHGVLIRTLILPMGGALVASLIWGTTILTDNRIRSDLIPTHSPEVIIEPFSVPSTPTPRATPKATIEAPAATFGPPLVTPIPLPDEPELLPTLAPTPVLTPPPLPTIPPFPEVVPTPTPFPEPTPCAPHNHGKGKAFGHCR